MVTNAPRQSVQRVARCAAYRNPALRSVTPCATRACEMIVRAYFDHHEMNGGSPVLRSAPIWLLAAAGLAVVSCSPEGQATSKSSSPVTAAGGRGGPMVGRPGGSAAPAGGAPAGAFPTATPGAPSPGPGAGPAGSGLSATGASGAAAGSSAAAGSGAATAGMGSDMAGRSGGTGGRRGRN